MDEWQTYKKIKIDSGKENWLALHEEPTFLDSDTAFEIYCYICNCLSDILAKTSQLNRIWTDSLIVYIFFES